MSANAAKLLKVNSRPHITIIAAIARNGVIGRDNDLPWHLSSDLQRFKRETVGKPIIMGRKTWESLPGLLPERQHIIVTRASDYRVDGATVAHSLGEALALAEGSEVCVIGGAQLYAAALPLADQLLVTEVDAIVDGDTHFPDFDPMLWTEVDRNLHPADARNDHAFAFVELIRRDDRISGDLSDDALDVSGVA